MFKAIQKKLKDQRGLTLIELLAVIVILGIIAAIAIPSIGGIINKSKDDAKVAEALQIISAAKLAHSSNSRIVNWKHTPQAAVTTGTTSPEYGGLSTSLDNVKDTGLDYEVNYNSTSRVYSIKNHDAAGVISNEATTGTLTEQELLNYSN
ncbi:MAG: prepilin-type N-terminal cleavage/methylation domain-containing protein [Mesobacillus sp.]